MCVEVRAGRDNNPGDAAGKPSASDYYHWDNLWAWRGLLDAAQICRWTAAPGEAEAFEAAAERLRARVMASLERVARTLGHRVMTAGPTRAVDAAMVGTLAACHPLRLLEPGDPWVAGTLEVVRQRFTRGEAFFQSISHTGLGTYLTLARLRGATRHGRALSARQLAVLLTRDGPDRL